MTNLRNVVVRCLTDVRLEEATTVNRVLIDVYGFIAEVRASALLGAKAMGCKFLVSVIGFRLAVYGARQSLQSSVSNLLSNAFKFTAPETQVLPTVYADDD